MPYVGGKQTMADRIVSLMAPHDPFGVRMTTYLGALSHGDERLALHRDGDLIHWEAAWRGSSTGPPRRAHDAIEQWITSVTDDWTEQAELRRRALDIRYRIDHKETS